MVWPGVEFSCTPVSLSSSIKREIGHLCRDDDPSKPNGAVAVSKQSPTYASPREQTASSAPPLPSTPAMPSASPSASTQASLNSPAAQFIPPMPMSATPDTLGLFGTSSSTSAPPIAHRESFQVCYLLSVSEQLSVCQLSKALEVMVLSALRRSSCRICSVRVGQTTFLAASV
jgi:hypothetical protein